MKLTDMRIVFMGTPDFAEQSLRELIENQYEIAGVFCQPDKPSGRKMEITFSPVKTLAIEKNIPVFQPQKMRDGTALNILKDLNPDIIGVVAYGRILPVEILELPKFGVINVHGSLLPKYRGAAPIQWSVINGDEVGGVTTMYLAPEMDTGDIIYSESVEIGEYETAGELYDRLKVVGAKLLVKTLKAIEDGSAPRIPQNNEEASYVTILDKSVCPIDWNKTPRQILKQIYGLQPWPVATADIGNQVLKLFAADYSDTKTELLPGSVVSTGQNGIEMACGRGECLYITKVQAPGKKCMSAADYVRGHKLV